MSLVCSICQEALTERPQQLSEAEELIICALVCGHLFHRVCITQWFNNGESVVAAYRAQQQGNCPCCKKYASLTNALRIFPTCEEVDDRANQKELRTLKSGNKNLETKLELTKSALDLEKALHNTTREKYLQATSQLSNIQEDLHESVSTEKTLRSNIEKLEKEKEEALQQLGALKSHYNEKVKDMERLKIDIEKLQLKTVRKQKELEYLEASLFSKDSKTETEVDGILDVSMPSVLLNVSHLDSAPKGSRSTYSSLQGSSK